MSTESIEVSGVIQAAPERIYQAWLNSSEHSAMTGGRATVDPNIGGRFSVWNGYAEGSTIELEPGRRIVQRWRSTEFPLEAADSLLEIRFEPLENGTRVAFLHSEIPEGMATKYEQGWREQYLEPMGRYFSSGSAAAEIGGAPAAEPMMGEAEAPKPKPKPPAKKAAPKPAAKKAAPKKAAPAKKKKSAKKSKKAASRRSARKPAARKATRKGKSRSSKKRSARRGKR
jgi:uncharacterized protein YndB with AHSA1/START domain